MLYPSSCPRCRGATEFREEEQYFTLRCLSCGLEHVRPIPSSTVPQLPQMKWPASKTQYEAKKRREKAWELHMTGVPTDEIIRQMKLSQRTVLRYLQDMRDEQEDHTRVH